MVVKLGYINFPVDPVLGSVLNSDREISAVVESAEFTGRDLTWLKCTGSRGRHCRFFEGLSQTVGFASLSIAFLQSLFTKRSIKQM